MGKPNMGNTPNEIVEHYFPGLPSKPKKHALEYILRLACLYRWRIGASLDEVPHNLGEGILALELREQTETLAVRALYNSYIEEMRADNPDWTEFDRLADSLPQYARKRGPDAFPWTALLPVLPLNLFGKNAKLFPPEKEQ